MNADRIHDTAMKYALNPNDTTLNEAVLAALPLCSTIANRFSGRGIETEDLKQVAAMALVEALKRFDPTRGLRFTTYVTPTITGKVRNYIRDKAQLLRSPRGLKEQGIKMDRAVEKLTQELRREPSVQELAKHLNWSIDQILEIQSMRERTSISSLDAQDDDGLYLFDRIGDDDKHFELFETREDLKKAFKLLSETEIKLITLRYSDSLSQSVVAKKLGMTQMQVSRMERRILNTLKNELEH